LVKEKAKTKVIYDLLIYNLPFHLKSSIRYQASRIQIPNIKDSGLRIQEQVVRFSSCHGFMVVGNDENNYNNYNNDNIFFISSASR